MNTDTLNSIPLQNILDKFNYNQELKKSMKCIFPSEHKHRDKNHSAGYVQKKNTYYCQGCGANLNPVNFIMNELKCDVSEALKWGENNFGNGKVISTISFSIPTSEPDNEIKPNPKVYSKIMSNGREFENDFRGIRKELLNSFGIREGFRDYLNKLPNDDKLLKVLKGCGVVTTNDKGSDYFILKSYDIFIPYVVNGEIVNVQGANSTTRKNKYCFLSGIEKPLFNIDTLKGMKAGDELWITEGVIDCLTLIDMGLKAVGFAGSKGSFQKFKGLFKGFKVKSILDNDKAGNELGIEMMKSGLDVEVFKWKDGKGEKYDVNDFIQEYEGATMKDLLEQVETYKGEIDNTPETIVEGLFLSDLDEFIEHTKKVRMGEIFGLKLNSFPLLENKLDGVQEGLWLIVGGTNIGKTALLVNLTLDLLKSNEGLKVLFFQVDGSTGEIYGRLLSLLGGTSIEITYKLTGDRDMEARKKFAYEALKEWGEKGRLDIVNTDTVDSIDKLKAYCEKYINQKIAIVIDGSNYLETGKRDGLEADKFMSKELKNISSHFHCPVITTCEVRKTTDTKNLTPEKAGTREMTVEDVKGSTSLGYKANLITSVSLMNDDDFEKDISGFQVQVIKTKMIGGKKGRVTMEFNKPYCRLTEKDCISYEDKKKMKKKTTGDDKINKDKDDYFDNLKGGENE